MIDHASGARRAIRIIAASGNRRAMQGMPARW
jgi:hypothetical protein